MDKRQTVNNWVDSRTGLDHIHYGFTMGSLWAKNVKLQRQQNQNSKVKILEKTKFIGRIMSHRINV